MNPPTREWQMPELTHDMLCEFWRGIGGNADHATIRYAWARAWRAAPKAPPMPEEVYDAMLKIVGSAAMVMDEAAMKPFIEWARAQGLVSAKD